MSLRARLIIGLVSLAAVGLLLAGALTYAEQRQYLYQRVDDQLDAAIPVVRDAFATAPATGGARAPGLGRHGRGGPGDGDDGPGGPRSPALSSRTYGEQRAADGRTVLHREFPRESDAQTTDRPNLPAVMKAGERVDVGSTGSSGVRYRAVATSGDLGLLITAVPLTEAEEPLNRLLLVEGLVIGGVLLALTLVAGAIVRIGLRPLDRIGETAGAIAAGDLSRRVEPAGERTEVGRLGLALNAMLERLERAFAERHASEERLRRFLADASHELRTPLASIRGYAELFRIGAAREGADVEKAMSRIEDESARMGVLVEDLLALARLDEVRDAHREPVDLVALAGDAVDDARAVAPDREIALLTGDEPLMLDGDPGQLRQVLSNLMRNALVHTPAGTPVEVAVSHAGGDLVLEVRDHGPGLPAGDPAELFERFWRADPGRGRGRAGAGLGLSIVAAVVAAHGGHVEAQNAAKGGARFTVTLPASARKEGSARSPAAPRPASDA
jgi:two-component system OmpR family sensor kinase